MATFLFGAGLNGMCENGRLVVCPESLPKTKVKTLGSYTAIFASAGLVMATGADELAFEIPVCPEALAAWKLLAKNAPKRTRKSGRFSFYFGFTKKTARISWSASATYWVWMQTSSAGWRRNTSRKGIRLRSGLMNIRRPRRGVHAAACRLL